MEFWRDHWRSRAHCIGQDPELFFPVGVTGATLPEADEARGICAGCPVRQTCLDWALRTKTGHGIWGGLTENERREI